MSIRAIVALFLLLPCMPGSESAIAQETEKRWTIGAHAGINLWSNDLQDPIGGDGWELMLRYGVARWFSFGLQGGYEELKASNKPFIPGLAADYMKLHSFPASFTATIHLLPDRRVAPFIYFGVGGLIYQRKDGLGNFVGGNALKFSYHLPVGAGIETFLFDDVSFVVEGGYRFLDDKTDTFVKGSNDSYLEAKAGLNWYFGRKRHCREIDDYGEDPDKDGLTMDEEEDSRTNPCHPDSDGDGLNDGDEVHKHKTDPNKRDTDGDGLTDYEEIFTHKTHPLNPDTDGDGLTDGDEVNTHKTNPNKADTDGDGLSDGFEVLTCNAKPNIADHADPLKPDTDGDILTDGDEINKYKTQPSNHDTDGDGCSDGDEVLSYKTDPLKKDCSPVVEPSIDTTVDLTRKFVVANFTLGKSLLPDTVNLAKARVFLEHVPDVSIHITGHADSTGSDAFNMRLSRQRAEVVQSWFMKRGISKSRMTTEGKGSREPIAPNNTAEGRARNRRVEIQTQ